MKTITILIAIMFSAVSYAEQCSTQSNEETVEDTYKITTDVPKHLQGATICVKLADGKESCVPAEKFKVVARKQQFIVSKTKQQSVTTCQSKVDKEKNRISLLGGSGPSGSLKKTVSPNKATIETETEVIGGAQYQRLITDKISVGVQGQTNESILINIGYDF